MPGDATAQSKGIHRPAVIDRPGFRERRHRKPIWTGARQSFKDQAMEIGSDGIGGGIDQQWIEMQRCADNPFDIIAARHRARDRCAGQCQVAHEQEHRERADCCYQDLPANAACHGLSKESDGTRPERQAQPRLWGSSACTLTLA